MNHGTQRKHRRNGAEIQAVVERYAQSGLSQSAFVQSEGICLATLSRYLKKTRTASPGEQPAAGFIEVEHGGGMFSPGNGGGNRREPYRVNFGSGTNLEIPSGFCTQEVACLLELLSRGGAQ